MVKRKVVKAELRVIQRVGEKPLYRALVSADSLAAADLKDAPFIRMRLLGDFLKGKELSTDEFLRPQLRKGATSMITIPPKLIVAKGLEKAKFIRLELLGSATKEDLRLEKTLEKTKVEKPSRHTSSKDDSTPPSVETSIILDVQRQLAELTELARRQAEQPSEPRSMDELTQLKEQFSKSAAEIEAVKTRLAGLDVAVSDLNEAVTAVKVQVQEFATMKEKLSELEKKMTDAAKPLESPKPQPKPAPAPSMKLEEKRVSLKPVEVKVVKEEPPPYTPPPHPSWKVEKTLFDLVKIWDEKGGLVAPVATKPNFLCGQCRSTYCEHVQFIKEWLKTQKPATP